MVTKLGLEAEGNQSHKKQGRKFQAEGENGHKKEEMLKRAKEKVGVAGTGVIKEERRVGRAGRTQIMVRPQFQFKFSQLSHVFVTP